MKKRLTVLCVCILAAAVLIAYLAGSRMNIPTFDLEDFAYEMEYFSSDAQIDALIENHPVRMGEDAMKIAERVWLEIFGEDTIISERPYIVSFDKKNGVWLVSGTLRDGLMGGAAHILIRKSDSTVLAAWHDR